MDPPLNVVDRTGSTGLDLNVLQVGQRQTEVRFLNISESLGFLENIGWLILSFVKDLF